VCIDANSHCRLVDDSKLLTKNILTNLGTTPSSPGAANPAGWQKTADSDAVNNHADATSPKLADERGTNSASLQTNASEQPLLQPRPHQDN